MIVFICVYRSGWGGRDPMAVKRTLERVEWALVSIRLPASVFLVLFRKESAFDPKRTPWLVLLFGDIWFNWA